MNPRVSKWLNNGFDIYLGDEKSSYILSQKRNEHNELVDYVFVCNLHIWNKEEAQSEYCIYTSNRMLNMDRHILAEKHHKWKNQHNKPMKSSKFKSHQNLFLQ